ncbi:uncharacterized protein TRIVIDRAFT_221753 [Trichoderma virens Gv29-8]|uniref:Myb-like domain-containing protein n=1 Tax=Hypocrea virens (strain Gv29-8 / FGSC 10586) TaxID=413071 RepID=G9MQV2_HYPVG|nr:uncharacterized protein TRIVIDRAFT_221753 [Trichoderma virens Gv29-8]EHK22481.1 hypothetical protein TRIVIDRAFT_221753 [Trichoderma virens Gv29-8]
MQTRRSKKAVEPPPSSSPPQPTRRNPPRATKRRGSVVVIRHSSSSPSPPPSSSPIRPRASLLLLPPPLPAAVPSLPPPPATPSNSSPVLPSIEPPKGLTSVPRKGSIVFDPVPRRGAPRHLSVSSIATNPRRDNTDDEYDETLVPEPKSAAQLQEEEMVQRDVEEAEHAIKLEAVASLARDAKNLVDQFQNKSRPSYEKVLLMKLQTFRASRSRFLAPRQASPFLDWDWVDKAGAHLSEPESVTVPLSIKLANIATALMQIESIESEGDNPVPFLEAVDILFPMHFAADNTQYRAISLELRTQRAIESIARSPQATDLRGMLGHAFCNMNAPDAPSDYGTLFIKGPYKPLADLDQQSLVDVCSNRVSHMWKIMSDGGKRGIRTPVDLPSIRAQYPLKHTLDSLKQWLLARYSTLSLLLNRAEQEKVDKEKEKLLDEVRAEEQRLFREHRRAREEEQRALEEEHRAREEQQRAKEIELKTREEAQQVREREQQAREREQQAREMGQRAREAARQERERVRELVRGKHTQEQERARKERQAQQDRARREEERWAREGRYPELPPLGDDDSFPYHDDFEASSQDLISSQPEPPPRRFQSRDRDSSLFMGRQLVGLLGSVSLAHAPSGSSRKRSYQESEYQSESVYFDDDQEEELEEELEEEEEEEEEEEDDFEEDPRPFRKGKATASSAIVHRHRELQREREDGDYNSYQAERRPTKRGKTTSSSAPAYRREEYQREYRRPAANTSTARPLPSIPSSSAPDFTAIKQIKHQARLNARLAQPQTLKRRCVWSDHDSATLVDLIARRAAAWSTINREDSHLFERPRDAQAYRDRARNMKVDFLISDAVLPRGFDLVTLSRKEIDRLQKLGKNHARRENDIDSNGRPINTEADMYWLES